MQVVSKPPVSLAGLLTPEGYRPSADSQRSTCLCHATLDQGWIQAGDQWSFGASRIAVVGASAPAQNHNPVATPNAQADEGARFREDEAEFSEIVHPFAVDLQ